MFSELVANSGYGVFRPPKVHLYCVGVGYLCGMLLKYHLNYRKNPNLFLL